MSTGMTASIGSAAPVLSIKRVAVHDGDGIRTTVFLAGCPLRCLWCHNPEGFFARPSLAYRAEKCLSCGICAAACPAGAHRMENGLHILERGKCTACGACAEQCVADALTLYGRTQTPAELLPLLLEDKPFYESSGGGVTLSGGECLTHPDFCRELSRLLLSHGVKTDIDTSGAVPYSALEAVLDTTDHFLYDIKDVDPAVHRRCTGQTSERILENLCRLLTAGAKVEIRVPFVPDHNAEEMEKIADFLSPLPVEAVRIVPYHAFAASKYESLGMPVPPEGRVPTKEETDRVRELFRTKGLRVRE